MENPYWFQIYFQAILARKVINYWDILFDHYALTIWLGHIPIQLVMSKLWYK